MGNIVVGNKLAKHLSAKLKAKFCPVEFTKFIDGPVKPRILNFSKAKFGILLLDMYQDIDINDYLINFLLNCFTALSKSFINLTLFFHLIIDGLYFISIISFFRLPTSFLGTNI